MYAKTSIKFHQEYFLTRHNVLFYFVRYTYKYSKQRTEGVFSSSGKSFPIIDLRGIFLVFCPLVYLLLFVPTREHVFIYICSNVTNQTCIKKTSLIQYLELLNIYANFCIQFNFDNKTLLYNDLCG